MSVQTRPLIIKDFTGGIDDNYIDAPTKTAKELDNFFILENQSLRSRFGSHIDDDTNTPQIPAGAQRIQTAINYDKDDKLFIHSANRIYFRDPATYSTLQGPSGNDLWSSVTVNDPIAHAQWKKHIFLTSSTYETPKKIYKDDANLYQLRTAGLPKLASDPTITPSVAGASTFLYAFVHQYTYKAGQEEFQDFGPTRIVEVENSDDPSVNQNNISAIPVLANGATESYDTANIKIKIYRTIDGGNTFYEIGEVTNGTTVFVDNFSDATIQSNATLYTTGGVPDNDPPPLAKYITQVGPIAYYGNIKEGTDEREFEVRQSQANDPDSVPATYNVQVDDKITGMGSIQSVPITFCRRHIYRLEGNFDELGRGFITPIRIDDTAGCVSHNSIVQAKNAVFWAGNDGFYVSDGYKVEIISDHLKDRYKDLLSNMSDPTKIVGTYDEDNEKIYWAVQADASNPDNDSFWVMDLRWGITKKSTFTTMSGGSSFAPSAITTFAGDIIRADRRGYVFIHNVEDDTDPMVNTSVQPTEWSTQAIIWLYEGFATNFGTDVYRKWVTRMQLSARNITNLSLAITAINDDGRITRTITPIRYRGNFIWGDPEFTWGDPQFVWNAEGLILQARRMARGGLRCSYLQMRFTNSFTVITTSEGLGTATVNNVAKTVTLDTAATADWPEDIEGYFIAFEDDNFTREYEILSRLPDTITYEDASDLSPSGSQKWTIRGTRKGEVLNLLSYTLNYAAISQSQGMFETGQSGEISGT